MCGWHLLASHPPTHTSTSKTARLSQKGLTDNAAAESGLPEFENETADAAVLPFSADEQERAEQIVADVIAEPGSQQAAELSDNVVESTEDSSLPLGLSSEPRTTFSADIQL